MNKGKLVVLVVVAALIAAFFIFDLKQYLSLDYVKSQQENFAAFVRDNALLTAGAYFAIYVAVTGLSLPGAAVLTLVGGAIFGLLWGTIIVSFASSIGATLAFLASRFLLRDWVQAKFGDKLKPINEGVAREGAFYLFALRLVPAFPFVAINLLMGLTPIPPRTVYWVSQIGILPPTIVYGNPGTHLATLKSISAILSPALIRSLPLPRLFPPL